MVGARRTRVPRLARGATGGHVPHGSEHLPTHAGLRRLRDPSGNGRVHPDEEASVHGLTGASNVVFSASLEEPLTWANTTLVRDHAVEVVPAIKQDGSGLLNTIGSISLCRSLLRGRLVDRFRIVIFPVITGATGAERIYHGYPDVALELIDSRTFDGRIQLVECRPRVLEHPPARSQSMIRAGAVDVGTGGGVGQHRQHPFGGGLNSRGPGNALCFHASETLAGPELIATAGDPVDGLACKWR